MTHILNLSLDNPVVHLKAYSSVQIKGVNRAQVACTIDSPQLATLTEVDSHVYITVNANCQLELPENSSIEIERALGSLKIENIKGRITADKVLSSLVLSKVDQANVGMVGGSFSVQNASGAVVVDKVAGNLTVDHVRSFKSDKVGGSCTLRNIEENCRVENAGGNCLAQGLTGETVLSKFGGSIKAREVVFWDTVKAGGNINLANCRFEKDLNLSAGGNVKLALAEGMENIMFKFYSGAQRIHIKVHGDDISTNSSEFEHQFGDGERKIKVNAGGSIFLTDEIETGEELVGDLTSRFDFKESPLSQLIQERINTATRRAEEKVKAAELRLEKIMDRVDSTRDIDIDFGLDDDSAGDKTKHVSTENFQAKTPVSSSVDQTVVNKKGATNEERLMILQMLQDNKITVDEAEALFKAMEG